jgi:S1-C subfamily serine protease
MIVCNAAGWRSALLAGFLASGLALSAQYYERSNPTLTPQEQETVEYNRKLTAPRKPTPRPPLTPAEAARLKAFNSSRNSVVFIHSSTRNFFYYNQQGQHFAIPPASGTGFVWDEFGHVVTNHHVIVWEDETEKGQGRPRREADDLQVTLADGKSYKAVVIGRSLALDIAVLHVFAPLGAMHPLPIGTSRDLKVGQDVTAIGNHTLTAGVVSALGRDILTNFDTHITGAIQTDAAINPGNSGGPLLDRAGRLLGMNTAITSSSGASSGVGFAIPVDTLNKVVPVLIARGQASRPTLGFLTLKDAIAQEMGILNAVAVAEVEPGGMAEKAGLLSLKVREGAKEPYLATDLIYDQIVAVNGVEMKSEIQLMDYLELLPADTVLEFDILRDKKPMKIRLDPSAEIRLPSGPEVKS